MQSTKTNDSMIIFLAARVSLGSKVRLALAGAILVAIGLFFMAGCEPNARIDSQNEELSANALEQRYKEDALKTSHEGQILNDRREMVMLNVKQAMLACKVIEDPKAMQGTREDAMKTLQDVMNDLRRLEASLDPKSPDYKTDLKR